MDSYRYLHELIDARGEINRLFEGKTPELIDARRKINGLFEAMRKTLVESLYEREVLIEYIAGPMSDFLETRRVSSLRKRILKVWAEFFVTSLIDKTLDDLLRENPMGLTQNQLEKCSKIYKEYEFIEVMSHGHTHDNPDGTPFCGFTSPDAPYACLKHIFLDASRNRTQNGCAPKSIAVEVTKEYWDKFLGVFKKSEKLTKQMQSRIKGDIWKKDTLEGAGISKPQMEKFGEFVCYILKTAGVIDKCPARPTQLKEFA